MPTTFRPLVPLLALGCAAASAPALAFFQLGAPLRFTLDGDTIRFDEVSIAETVVPCTRRDARLKLQVRATDKPYQPPQEQRGLPFPPYQAKSAQGVLLLERDLSPLGPAEFGCPYEAFDVAWKIEPPPPGRYFLGVFLFAYPSPGDAWCVDFRYCLEDWHGFPDAVTFPAAKAQAPARKP